MCMFSMWLLRSLNTLFSACEQTSQRQCYVPIALAGEDGVCRGNACDSIDGIIMPHIPQLLYVFIATLMDLVKAALAKLTTLS